MANRIGCHCPRCTIRGLMGPAVLITIGVLFLLHEVRGAFFDFSNTYPSRDDDSSCLDFALAAAASSAV